MLIIRVTEQQKLALLQVLNAAEIRGESARMLASCQDAVELAEEEDSGGSG